MTRVWNTACLDWQTRIRERRSLLPALPLYPQQAQDATDLFDLMCLPDVAGLPALRDAAGDWFRDAIRGLFGSFDESTGQRHVRECFMLVPKKNSKTSYSAALMLVAVLRARRPRAEFLLVAPTQEIADYAFAQAQGMIDASPVLSVKCHVQPHLKRISYRQTGAFLKVKSFDPSVVTGSKPSGVLLDELHVISQQHDADRVIGQLRGGMVSQPESFFFMITTQSERPPSGVFKSELAIARKVRDGKLVMPLLPLLYEFPDGVDWKDTDNWPMVLPNLGRSITLERLQVDYDRARAAGDAEVRRWASQHINVEVGQHIQDDSWAGALYWQRTADPSITVAKILDRCDVVVMGIDGGGLDDLLGIAVVGRDKETGDWLAWMHAWCHAIAMQRRLENAPIYKAAQEAGQLTIVSEIGQDVDDVADLAQQLDNSGLLFGVGADPAGIGAIIDALEDAGIEEARRFAVSQGWRLVGAIKTTERRLAANAPARRLLHNDSAFVAWCVGNAKVEQRANSILISKAISGTGKIDPVMALFDAIELLSHNPAPRYESVYEELARQTGAGAASGEPAEATT